MSQPLTPPTVIADKAALARLGATVRARLDSDPAAYRIQTDDAEIYAVGDFLTPAECRLFIDMVDVVAKPSQVLDHGYAGIFRTSWSGDVNPHDPFVKMIERRIDDLLGIEGGCGETVQGQRYHPTQEFKEHCDWFHTGAGYWPQERRRGGQRSWTAMIYLNDVEEGGETHFVRLGISIPPQQGALLTWNNANRDGSPNDRTMHAALPVVRGTKYVITKWYRTRRWV
ncbi:MAG: 2OG-Fe(II) oxygenase [Novosphingobium sp.]|nr:2OG-Fe(II) oxygenase [Novosphingobium sp.]